MEYRKKKTLFVLKRDLKIANFPVFLTLSTKDLDVPNLGQISMKLWLKFCHFHVFFKPGDSNF